MIATRVVILTPNRLAILHYSRLMMFLDKCSLSG